MLKIVIFGAVLQPNADLENPESPNHPKQPAQENSAVDGSNQEGDGAAFKDGSNDRSDKDFDFQSFSDNAGNNL